MYEYIYVYVFVFVYVYALDCKEIHIYLHCYLLASELWLEGRRRQDKDWQEHLRSYIPVFTEVMPHSCREMGVENIYTSVRNVFVMNLDYHR